MCRQSKILSENIKKIVDGSVRLLAENGELKKANVLGNLSMEGTKDIIYASDMETYEILYLNQTAQKVFGNKLGEKCYKVFHNLDSPCKHCNMKDLKNNMCKPVNWVLYNQVVQELYYITDIGKEIDGKMVRFERATPLNGLTKDIVKLANKYQLL